MGVVVAVMLAGIAWFGHAFLMTAMLNQCFARAWPRRWLKRIRHGVALAVFAFPFVFVAIYHRQLLAAWREPGGLTETPAVFAYLMVCWATTLVYLPLASALRHFRRRPLQLVDCRAWVEDVAKSLGGPPVGNGKYWRLTRLPGNECFRVEFRELSLRLPRVPAAWEGLTILHLTDLHFCGSPGRDFYRRVLDVCRAAGRPDILAITGDVVDSQYHHKWILPLLGRLEWTVAAYAILGNHDKYHDAVRVRRRLRRIGVRVIGNGVEEIDVRGERMLVIGNETPWFGPAPLVPAAGDRAARRPFRLCLSHAPDSFSWAQANDVDLMLAGHVHGGQVRLPLVGSVFVPSRYGRRYDRGAFTAGPTFMSVSRGLAGGEPLRYYCKPEVTWIKLFAATGQ
jgi:predicted MPP superfamily phosphohydrolase